MNLDVRLKQCILNWRDIGKGRGTILIPRGIPISDFISSVILKYQLKNKNRTVVIGCRNKSVKELYSTILKDKGILSIGVKTFSEIPNSYKTIDLFIGIDINESVVSPEIYTKINPKFILGITSVFERLDGKHSLLQSFCPVIDSINVELAQNNGWINKVKEYKVLVDVDLQEYKEHDKKFQKYFNFFNRDIEIASACRNSIETRKTFASFKRCDLNVVNACTFGTFKEMEWRKKFIETCSKKILLANEIINTYCDCKVVTISPTIDISKKLLGVEFNSANKSIYNLDQFNNMDSNINCLNLCKKFDSSITNTDVCIITSHNSSSFDKSKIYELLNTSSNPNPKLFTLVLRDTIEEEWARLSIGDLDYITISERQLKYVLLGEEIIEERVEGNFNVDRF